MLVRRYEMPWRRAYEVYAGIAWWLALLYFVGVGVAGALPRQLALPLALVLGGALGNVIDRAVLGYVVDFLYFHYRDFAWPAFNIADSAIFIGAVWLVWDSLLGKHETRTTP